MFPKFTYEQEMNLSNKLKNYNDNKVSYDIIKKKIKNKIDSILNLGQTPHKLFDEKHPRKIFMKIIREELMPNVEILMKKINVNLLSFTKGIKYFNFTKNFQFFLTSHKEIVIFDKILKKKSKVRLKMHEKMNVIKKKILNTNYKIYLNKEKYRIIELKDSKIFISCGHMDQSIKVYYNEKIVDYHFKSLVTCLLKNTEETILYTGHINGKLSIWNMTFSPNNEMSLTLINEFITHEEAITSIYNYERLGLILSGSDV